MLSVKLGNHMQLTYQDMLKNFEKTYRYYNYPDSAYIEEEFKTDHGNTFHIASNVDTAMTELKNDIEQTWNSKINHLEQMKTNFRNLSFFEKLNWQLKHKKINFDSTAEDRKKMINEHYKNILDTIHVKYIDQNQTYIVNSPKIVHTGDTLYVVVTDHNSLDIGIYEATITRANYFSRFPNNSDSKVHLEFDGVLKIMEKSQEFTFSFSANDKDFISSYSYHNIFTDKSTAIEFHNESIQTKLKEMEEKLIKIDPSFKPQY